MTGPSEISTLGLAALSVFDFPHASLEGATLLAALAATGLVIGLLTGLFGVGGGFMVVPLLSIAFHVDYRLAIGSSLVFTVGTGAGGLMAHRRLNNIAVKTMLIITGGAVCGAPLGAMLVEHLSGVLGEKRFTTLMDILFIAMLLVVAALLVHGTKDRPRVSLLQKLPLPPHIHIVRGNLHGVSLPGLVAVGLFIGVLKGMLGVGGGVMLVPLLMVVVGLPVHQAVGTSLGVVLFSSISGAVKYGLDGYANLWIAMALLVGSAVGVQAGIWLGQKLGGGQIKRYFAILVLLVAASLAARQIWGNS